MKEGDLLKFLLDPLFTDTESDKFYLKEAGIDSAESRNNLLELLKKIDSEDKLRNLPGKKDC